MRTKTIKIPKLLTIEELSEKTGVAVRTLYQWLSYGKIFSVKEGHALFTEDMVELVKKLKKKKGRQKKYEDKNQQQGPDNSIQNIQEIQNA